MQSNSIAIIPARGGSKGLEKKNLREFLGHPLIAWPIEAAKRSKKLSKIVVSTDDKDIREVALKYGAEVPFLRTSDVSGDLTTTEETLKYSLLESEKIFKQSFDICVFLTCTDLFRRDGWIDHAIDALEGNDELESVFVANETHKNFWEVIDNNPIRFKEWMSVYESRQVRRKSYREDTGLACASRSNLWRNGRRIGDNVQLITDNRSFSALDIHNDFDLFLANKAAEWIKENDFENLPPVPKII